MCGVAWCAAVYLEFAFGRLGVTKGQASWLAKVGRGVLIGQGHLKAVGVRAREAIDSTRAGTSCNTHSMSLTLIFPVISNLPSLRTFNTVLYRRRSFYRNFLRPKRTWFLLVLSVLLLDKRLSGREYINTTELHYWFHCLFARRLSTMRLLQLELNCIQDYNAPLMKNKHAITSVSMCYF